MTGFFIVFFAEKSSFTLRPAAKGRHLDLLKWGRSQGCPWEYDRVKAWAVLNGDQNMIEWLEENQEEENYLRQLAP